MRSAGRYLLTSGPDLHFNPETIMMADTMPGISFTETMKGPFSLDAADPLAGRALGASTGTTLAMHVTVTVRDVDRFVADPDHNGSIVGHIDFAPLGEGIPTGEGVFRLFSPAADAAAKLMVYELPFEHGGQSYYLAGHKEIRDDPGFDLWSDTTTLFTRLHRGTDKSAPVTGAGILRLGPSEFARVVASVRAIDTDSGVEAARLIGKFGQFFARELWQNYASIPAR